MKIDTVIEKLLVLVDSVENEILGDTNIGYYCGIEYTENDFKNMKRVLDRVHKVYKTNTKTSYKYIIKNKEYNKLLSLQNYYRRKVNKSEKDYMKLAELADKLDIERKRMREERENTNIKKKKKLKRIEIESKRRKELLDKYGFVNESD